MDFFTGGSEDTGEGVPTAEANMEAYDQVFSQLEGMAPGIESSWSTIGEAYGSGAESLSSSNESEVQYPDCAVGFMAWCNVRGFLTTLNQKTGKYFRLPSNAEWEYAARGGKYSRGYVFPGSNDWEEVSNRTFIDNTNPVGTKRPNELGLYDMSGGMVEWVEDYPYEYTSEPETDPRHVDNDAYSHITRWVGIYKFNSYGVWRWLPYEGYTSCRSDFGFRIVLSPEENWY